MLDSQGEMCGILIITVRVYWLLCMCGSVFVKVVRCLYLFTNFLVGVFMKLNAMLYSSVLAAAGMLFVAQNVSAADGGYGSSVGAPTISAKNYWYIATFPVVGTVPSTAKVGRVNYSWDYSYPRPSGLQVLLCNSTGANCKDVTNSGSGSFDFSQYSVSATKPLKLYARVNGTGTMSPLKGRSSSVTVNYSY
jgi:hypothetical protein